MVRACSSNPSCSRSVRDRFPRATTLEANGEEHGWRVHGRFDGSGGDPLVGCRPMPCDDAFERGHHPRVELVPGAAPELDQCVRLGHRAAIRARGGHRVVGIADRDDPGPEWNRLAEEAVWIAAAVPGARGEERISGGNVPQ